MKKIACIYKISFGESNRLYIGSTKNFSSRKRSHLSLLRRKLHKNIYLQNAYDKHSETLFSMSIVEVIDDTSKSNIEAREQHWLDHYMSYDRSKGYNILKKAYQASGFGNSDEQKRANHSAFMSGRQYAKGSKRTDEYKQWHREFHKNRKKEISQETRDKISKAHLGKEVSEETRNKLRQAGLGKTKSQNTKEKHSRTTARLSEGVVLELRRKHSIDKVPIKQLAEQIGYSYKTTQKIVSGKSYSWVK